MGRAPCCDKTKVKRGPWSPEEDTTLKNYLHQHGTAGNWISLPSKAGLKRCGKSCRLRWLNYLRPDIKHGGFTEEEDSLICAMYTTIGSRWSVIASRLPGRTDNDVKNHWNTKLKKKLLGPSATRHDQVNGLHTNMSMTNFVDTTVSPKIENARFAPDLDYGSSSSGAPNCPDFSAFSSFLVDSSSTNNNYIDYYYYQNLELSRELMLSDPSSTNCQLQGLPGLMEVSDFNPSLSSSSPMAQVQLDHIDYGSSIWFNDGEMMIGTDSTCLNNVDLPHSEFGFEGN